MKLLSVATPHERTGVFRRAPEAGAVIICDRYVASSVAYGEAQGLDAGWLRDIQRLLPTPDLTILLDIAPETAVQRKAVGRDRYERDRELQTRVRASYLRQAEEEGWVRIDGERDRGVIADEIFSAASRRLERPSAL
jgi:dTMP kinase